MATISHNQIAKSIYLAVSDKPRALQSSVLKNAVAVLSRRKMLGKKREILSALNKIINIEKNVMEAEIWSKDKLLGKEKNELEKFLSKKYGAKSFIFLEHLDDKLLGGFKVRVGDEMIDLTLTNRINKLKEHLTENYA